MIITFTIQLLRLPIITHTANLDLSLDQELRYNGVKVIFLNNKVVLIEFDEKYFYEYRGLYVITVYDVAKVETIKLMRELRNLTIGYAIPAKSTYTSYSLKFVDIAVDSSTRLNITVKKELLKQLLSVGVYPISMSIHDYTINAKTGMIYRIISIHVSGNSTIRDKNTLVNNIKHLLLDQGVKDYSIIQIVKLTIKNPITATLMKSGIPNNLWKDFETKMRNLLENCSSTFKEYCKIGLANYFSPEHDIAPAYTVPFFTRVLLTSNWIVFYLEGKYQSIWDIVNNNTLRERLNAFLDLIIDAFEELGIDHHGVVVVLSTHFEKPLGGSTDTINHYGLTDNSGETYGSSATKVASRDSSGEALFSLIVLTTIIAVIPILVYLVRRKMK